MPTLSSLLATANHHIGLTSQAHQTTTIAPLVSSVMSLIMTPSEAPRLAELTKAGHHLGLIDAQSDDIPAIQSPLLAGLENSSALIHAMLASFSVILVSELGDKTFIITAIMAMKNSRSLVFMSSALALFLMTVLSVGMGVAVTVIPSLYTHYASIVLFLCFGLKMLKEAYDMMGTDEEGGESEFEEVERSLEEKEKESAGEVKVKAISDHHDDKQMIATQATDQSTPIGQQPKINSGVNYWNKLIETLQVAPIVIKVFTMILVAEWGDRSQISTVILAAREDVVGVFVGSLSGHIICTGLAVIGGRVVAEIISIRTLTFIGGLIFLFFAAFSIIVGPE